jgi:hypothetical protein
VTSCSLFGLLPGHHIHDLTSSKDAADITLELAGMEARSNATKTMAAPLERGAAIV